MKFSRMKPLLCVFFLFALAGCDEFPHVFGGNEVPPSVTAEPRPVETLPPGAAQHDTWMRLGDVPSRPSDFTSEKLIDETKQEMRNDRAEAQRIQQSVDNPPPQN